MPPNNIDEYKQNTLRIIETRSEKFRTYPITKSDLIKINHCLLCGSKDIETLTEVYLDYKLKFFVTSVCKKCLYTFRSVSPSLSWFKKCWNKIKTKKLEVFNPGVEKERYERYGVYSDFIFKYHSVGTLLEIGASYGTGLNVFKSKGFKVEAIEAEINKVNYLKKVFKIPVIAESVEDFIKKNSKKKYDVILFIQCLEHIDNPQKIMSQLHKFLKPDGVVYLEVPVAENYVTWSDALYMTHKSNFTKNNIRHLAKNSGFDIIKEYKVRNAPICPWDIGLLLKLSTTKNSELPKESRNVELIRSLYLKNLPLRKQVKKGIIKFSVPYIEQFFQTLNLTNKKAIFSKSNPEFITFE